ncbi:hypothetical protein [Ideonella sp. B508-1]|uniref:hypothetical protein n=1 Tax=Ideonella sp. B508-1 TaxID=137716 RepID=UPI0003B78B65|nr:hypothetical protein [Ideonella sp. B508-1]
MRKLETKQDIYDNAVNIILASQADLCATPDPLYVRCFNTLGSLTAKERLQLLDAALGVDTVSQRVGRPLTLSERNMLRALRDAIAEANSMLDEYPFHAILLARLRDIGRARSLDLDYTYLDQVNWEERAKV